MYFSNLKTAPDSGGIVFETSGLGPAITKPAKPYFDGVEAYAFPAFEEYFGEGKFA